ncbi:MAG: RHS repeat-associated core domain-containing protein [Prevotella sp.]|nr:RHS repeat-associated core domain-containing protein [Prevotella sp.]
MDIYDRVRTFDGSDMSDCPFRYQGQYQDSETGLYYNRFRYYDPEVGNYISKDPIGLAGGDKLYAYVHDTNRFVDQRGLHQAYAVLNGNVVQTPNGGYYWNSTRGSSNAPFNGFGAAGHSEAKLLEHLETTLGKEGLAGGNLEIVSMGQMTKGGKSELSSLPPCPKCMEGLEDFAKRNDIDITYKWEEDGKIKSITFKGH